MTIAQLTEHPENATRAVVNALLVRARRFHCSVSGVAEYDVTELRARLRADRRGGRQVGLASALLRATATLIEEQPHLNRHVFTGLFGRRRVVEFKPIHCTLVVARRAPGGEDVLVPLLVREANTKSVEALEAEIRAAKSAPLDALEPVRAMRRLDKLPRAALSWFSYRARSDPHFYLRHFGSYGLSSLVRVGGHGVGGAALANTGVAFLPGSIRRLPRFVGATVVAREILSFGLVFDHFLFDGIQMLRATERLGELLEHPTQILGPERAA